MIITIRVDDVLVDSSAFKKERAIHRFKQLHRWVTQIPEKAVFLPTICVREIQEFPDAITFIKEETAKGTMSPQLHGYEHINYGKLTENEISKHLRASLNWFQENLDHQPTIWCTPWGAYSRNIVRAAEKAFLKVQTTHPTINLSRAINLAKENGVESLEGKIVMLHWYEKGLKLLRLVEIVKYGSYEKASEIRKDIFDG